MAEPLDVSDFGVADLGEEKVGAKNMVYLVTISRALPHATEIHNLRDLETTSRSEVSTMVRDAVSRPVLERGGRPREGESCHLQKLVVFQEQHADGSRHFHVALKFAQSMRWMAFKRTLRVRYNLCSHWSCSHTQWWSAVRYGVVPTSKKPLVDESPETWSVDGVALDLFEDSQQPFNAAAWRARREKRDCAASTKDEAPSFNKLDFTSLVLSKGLRTKNAVLAYVQEHGTVAMQNYVCKNQRQLEKHIEDAFAWGSAPGQAVAECETDWAVVSRTAAASCVFGDTCDYAAAAEDLFAMNQTSFSRVSLAAALRAVLVTGPSKSTPVPFLVGGTNCGKSTLVYPFDDVFGFSAVFHKPALNDASYPLRNWLKAKRFVFWDDYRPVAYAEAGVVPVPTFLSAFNGDPFEVRVPQNTHDGNVDFAWNRGVVFTGKTQGLWDPSHHVSAEDIQHLRSRVVEFHFNRRLEQMRPVPKCAVCMCRWIVQGAAAHDADRAIVAPPLLLPIAQESEPADPDSITGFSQLMAAARLAAAVVPALKSEVEATGAVHVNELTPDDWAQLPSWPRLREMERRRLLANVRAAS